MASSPTTISPLRAGVTGRCPRCGKGPLFAGNVMDLTVAPACTVCGLDFKFVDPGDGPAVFVIMLLGLLMLGLALFVEFTFKPPYWIHLAVFAPLTLVSAVGLLRPLKGLLIALQYHHKAEQGRLEK